MGAELVALGYLAKKAYDKLEDAFTDKVINRWRNHRARAFLDTFAEAVAQEAQDKGGEEKVNSLLDDLLSSETKTEILFEAYRRVVFSASKDLGPRIIALLTAHLIKQNRHAVDDEEITFRAAESFTDQELQSLKAYLAEVAESYNTTAPHFPLKITLHRKRLSVSKRRRATAKIGSMDLIEILGSWAPKAIQIGLLREEIVEETSYSGGVRDNDVEYEREIEWFLVFAPASARLVALIERAEESTSKA